MAKFIKNQLLKTFGLLTFARAAWRSTALSSILSEIYPSVRPIMCLVGVFDIWFFGASLSSVLGRMTSSWQHISSWVGFSEMPFTEHSLPFTWIHAMHTCMKRGKIGVDRTGNRIFQMRDCLNQFGVDSGRWQIGKCTCSKSCWGQDIVFDRFQKKKCWQLTFEWQQSLLSGIGFGHNALRTLT